MGKYQTTGKYICTDGAQPSAGIRNGKPDKNCAEASPRTDKEQTLWDSIKESYTTGATMDAQAGAGVPDMAYGMGKEIVTGAANNALGALEAIDTFVKEPAKAIAGTMTGYGESAAKLWNVVTEPGAAWNAYREQIAQRAAQAGPEGAGGAIASPINMLVGMIRPKGAKGVPPHENPPHKMPDAPPPNPKRGGGLKVIQKKKMQEHKPKCFKPGDDLKKNYKGEPKKMEKEFYRQLKDQEAGLNNMTVKQYMDNRSAYERIQRMGTGAAQDKARTNLAAEIADSMEKNLIDKGAAPNVAGRMAAEQTKQIIGELAALHNPDLKAGGADVIGRVGDKNVNSSIGSQWAKGDRISEMDAAAAKAMQEQRPDEKMNVKLERCPH